ncbi:MAG: NAD(P)H-hydrate dehydratase [Gammaproteobacteria bacterium]|nr:NAD(P)H-hydrate dehydratase [Gammaproteobacteria bacterium]
MAKSEGLYSAAQVRQLEQLYARFHDGSTYILMERAGAATYYEMRERWPEHNKVVVLCGKGNNGGDGFVVARLAVQAGLTVQVLLMPGAEKPEGDAERAYLRLTALGITPLPWSAENFASATAESGSIIIDALLGTGAVGAPRAEYALAVRAINQCEQPVIAVDIPSGLMADTGAVEGLAVHADLTVTFVAYKRGLFTGLASDYCGEIVLNDLKCGQGVFALIHPNAHRYRYQQGTSWLTPRRRTSHKGFFGHSLVLGGAPGFAGAARLCAEAAARTGSGLVSLLTHAQHAESIAAQRPEIMCHGVHDSISKDSYRSLMQAITAIAIGPGLSQLKWGSNLVALVEDFLAAQDHHSIPSVWDADALNLLAKNPRKNDNRILTPHPGEAARLLGSSIGQVQADRFAAIEQLQQRYGGVIVLKGSGTLVANHEQIDVINVGNPGMASGGMGDVLTGIIVGLLAQQVPLYEAARLAVAIHGEAAEAAVQWQGQRIERGLLAADLFPHIRQLVNP